MRVLIAAAALAIAGGGAIAVSGQETQTRNPERRGAVGASYREAGRITGGSLVDWTDDRPQLWESRSERPILLFTDRTKAATGRTLAIFANEIIVTLSSSDATKLAKNRQTKKFAGAWEIADATQSGATMLVRYLGPERLTAQQVYDRFRQETGLTPISAEPNQIGTLDSAQDRQYDRLLQPWAHRSTGRGNTKVDADIDGNEALARLPFAIPPGPLFRYPSIMVIDTGIDETHPALAGTLWTNAQEVPGDGRDNDGNGYRDDVNGWNFADGNALLFDPVGHGTHVAGIIAARPSVNSAAIRGGAPGSTIIVAKVSPSPKPLEVIKALEYARAKEASVVSMSLSFAAHSPAMTAALLELESAGTIVVASAGNDGRDVTVTPVYPCMNATVVCVAATDENDRLAPFSNYGASFGPMGKAGVAIAAPGVGIHATIPGGYGSKNGTSMAAPMVAAAMASTWRLFPSATHGEIRNRIVQTADRLTEIAPERVEEGRRLNLYQAFFSKAPRREYASDGYCNQIIYDPTTNQQHPRWTNSPFANSGEPGIDGSSFGGAYTICTVAQMANIQGEYLDGFFHLKTNLNWTADQSGSSLRAIGDRTTVPGIFNGVLDGGGFVIENFDQGLKQNAGLVARLGPRGQVTNLRFTNVNLRARNVAGVVSPSVVGGRIVNVQAEGRITAESAGGIAGSIYEEAEIRSSAFEGLLDTKLTSGGIAASAAGRTLITGSYFSGTILSLHQVGGIAGLMDGGARIERSHAFVTMPQPETGRRTIAGGLVGYLWCRSSISDSYAEGDIAASEMAGGLVGRLTNADIRQSYSSTFFSTANTGGAVGKIADGLLGDNQKYRCSETTVKPPASTRREDFYDSFQGGSGVGTPKSPSALRAMTTYSTWNDEIWDKAPGELPRLKRLPRSTHKDY